MMAMAVTIEDLDLKGKVVRVVIGGVRGDGRQRTEQQGKQGRKADAVSCLHANTPWKFRSDDSNWRIGWQWNSVR